MDGYNSGVCTRIKPTSFDDAPGYQVDMGDGYWGCVWDERRRSKKIFDFPKSSAEAIVKKGDWNHYYIRHVGTRTTIYLNGVKTADGDDLETFLSGPIGFQLCHGPNTVASFKNVYVKPLTKPTKGTAQRATRTPSRRVLPPSPRHGAGTERSYGRRARTRAGRESRGCRFPEPSRAPSSWR